MSMGESKARIRELRSRAQRKTSNLYDSFFTRRVSIYVTALLLPSGVTPNGVSMLNTVLGLTAWALIGLNVLPLVGVLLIHAYAVLDSVDGELARLTRRFSLKGLFLEDHSAYLMISGYWLAIGFYLWQTTDTIWLLAAGVALIAFGRQALPAARRGLIKSIETGRPLNGEGREVAAKPADLAGLARFVFVDVLHPTNVWVVTTSVLVIERLWVGSHTGLLAVATAYLALSATRELAVLYRFLTTEFLDRWLSQLYSQASRVPRHQIDPFVLAGDAPRREHTAQ